MQKWLILAKNFVVDEFIQNVRTIYWFRHIYEVFDSSVKTMSEKHAPFV